MEIVGSVIFLVVLFYFAGKIQNKWDSLEDRIASLEQKIKDRL